MNLINSSIALALITWILAKGSLIIFGHHCKTQLWDDYNQWLVKSKLSKTEGALLHQYHSHCSNFIRKKNNNLTQTNFYNIQFKIKGDYYNAKEKSHK